jgi:hypothetical protein
MLKKIFFICIIFSEMALFAGGGGGSSFGGETTQDKYGKNQHGESFIELPNTSTSNCSENIKIISKSSVRYRNWFYLTHEWKSGYATTTAKQCGKEVKISKMQIAQYANIKRYYGGTDYNVPVGRVTKYNVSFVKLGLKNADNVNGEIHTVHSVLKDGYSKHTNVFNDWSGMSLSIAGQTILEW